MLPFLMASMVFLIKKKNFSQQMSLTKLAAAREGLEPGQIRSQRTTLKIINM